MLAGFALPPLLQLSRMPALRVLRRDVGPPPPLVLLAFGPAVLAVAFLIYWVVRDPMLFLGFIGGLAVFLLVLAGAGAAAGQSRRAACAAASASPGATASRISAAAAPKAWCRSPRSALGFMVLLLLAIVRNDLIEDWRRSLPADVPNFFFINIPPQERSAFLAFLQTRGAQHVARAADGPRAADAHQRQADRGA